MAVSGFPFVIAYGVSGRDHLSAHQKFVMTPQIRKHLKRFTLLIVTAALLLLLVYKLLASVWPGLHAVTSPVLSIVMLTVVILGVFFVSLQTVTPQLFIQVVVLGTAVKLLLFGAYTFYLIYTDIAHARGNILFFFTGYVLLTILEITSLYTSIRERS